MKFKRTQVEDISINLTPMIDCLLFILIFLLLSTTFDQQSRLQLTLPDAQGTPPKVFDRKIEIMVDANGNYSVNGQALATKNVSDLKQIINQVSNERRDMVFIVSADAKASHQDVIRVLDVAGQLGFSNVNISTKIPARGFD